MAREYQIVYGAYTVGGASGPHIDGAVKMERDFERGSIEFAVIVTAATAAAFATACTAIETAFRKPYQDLAFTIDSQSLLGAAQSSRTALDPMPSIRKDDSVADTGRSRRYIVRIEFGLPANTTAEAVSGLRDLSVEASYDPSRKARVTLSGTFTGVGASSAYATYAAGIGTLATSALSTFSITYSELAEEPSVRYDTNNNLCDFTRVYDELIFSQAGSSLDDAAIVRQTLIISRRKEGIQDTPEAEKFIILDVSYDAWVDKTSTTDLTGKWDSIRAWVLTQAQNVLDGGAFALMSEEPSFELDANRISARMTLWGEPTGSDVIENRVTTDDDDAIGNEIVPVWSGRNTDAYVYSGPRVVVRTVTHTHRRLGMHTEQEAIGFGAGDLAAARGRDPFEASGGTWVLLSRRPSATQLRLGLGDNTIDVTDLSLVTKMRYVTNPPTVSGGHGGGGAVTDPRS